MAAAHLRGGACCTGGAWTRRTTRSPLLPLAPHPPALSLCAPSTCATRRRGISARASLSPSDPVESADAATAAAAASSSSSPSPAEARGPGAGGGSGRESPQLPSQAEVVFGGGAAADEGLLALLTPGTASRSVADLDYLTELLAIQANDGPKSIALFGSRNMGLTHQQLVEVLACALVAAGNRIYTSGATGTNAAVIKGALRAIEGDGSGGGGAAAGKGGAGGGGGSSLDAALASMGKARAADADNDPASGGAAAGAGGAATAAAETAAAADDDDDASAAAIDSSRLRPPPTTRPMAGDDDRLTVILPQSLSRQPQESRELLARVGRVVEMPRNDGLALLDASRICNREIIGSVQQVVCFAFRDSRLLLETCAEAKDAKKIVTLFYLD